MHAPRGHYLKKCLAVIWLGFLMSSLQVYLKLVARLKDNKGSHHRDRGPLSGALLGAGNNHSVTCQLNSTELESWSPMTVNRSGPVPIIAYVRDTRGVWSPEGCKPRSHLAVIVPYRDRADHLDQLLVNLHGVLRIQRLAYVIYVIEQVFDKKLNRGALRNIGYAEADKLDVFQCFVFHDVDLIPLNASNLYSCEKDPIHLSSAVDSLQFRVPYKEIFGGVVALTKTQFQSVNGYSNRFFHWGGEDDDMYSRLYTVGWRIQRRDLNLGRYTMLHHDKSVKNPYRFLQGWFDIRTDLWKSDGLKDLNYTVISRKQHQLYTWTMVDLDDSKADHFIQDAIAEIKQSLPERFRSLSDESISDAVLQLKQYYRGPYQVLKVIEQGLKAINPLIA